MGMHGMSPVCVFRVGEDTPMTLLNMRSIPLDAPRAGYSQ